jgi:ATP-binding cassette subfamily B protein/subfamily B ATP-binding cassette protein MsbA
VASVGTAWQSLSSLTLGLMPSWAGTSPMARLIRHTARGEKRLLLLNTFFTLLLGVAEACLFTMIYRTVKLLTGTPVPEPLQQLGITRGGTFMILLGALLFLQLIASSSRAMIGILSGRFTARCQAEIMPLIHRHILGLSYGCASSFKIGDLARRASIAPTVINTEITYTSLLISDGLLALVYLMILVLVSPWLMLLAFGLALGMGLAQSWLRPRIRDAAQIVENQQRHISSSITADLQVLRLLHSSASIGEANRRFAGQLHGLEINLRRLATFRSLLEPIAELLPTLAAVLIGLFSWKLTQGRTELMIPGLATFVLALQRLNVRLVSIGKSFNMLAENLAGIDQVNNLLNKDDKTYRRRGGAPFAGLQQEIRFEGVTLNYPGRSAASLSDVSFRLPRGSTLALVGASGAGKSTIADLLVGLIDPTGGRILIDGRDLRHLDLDSWQQRLGVVSQDVLLVNDTIAANITYGVSGPISDLEIHQAAEAAFADGFINQLPHGYDTVVGEQGHRLSGGQRQRLSLARAILRQPELLILDEATSALDSHSESRVHQAIQAFSSGRTVLVVAHRLSSIQDAGMILVVDGGRIVERGHHDQLLAAGGTYAGLWQRQQSSSPARRT